jgi:CheY-like chemotaxis protein
MSNELDSSIQLRIVDTGIGIDEGQLERVFDEFHQLNNPERNREKGLGLGLAIVQRLCHLANINIQLQSVVNGGTTMELLIPQGDPTLITQPTVSPPLSFAGALMVVIDDEKDILDSMQHLLKVWHCDVVCGADLNAVQQQLASLNQVPTMLICDFRLEGNNNGLDAIEALRDEYNRDIPALLITGDTGPDRIIAANEANCEVLYKPIDGDALEAAITRCLTQ